MTTRNLLVVIALIALGGAMMAMMNGCGSGCDTSTPTGVTVELLQVHDQYRNDIEPDSLDTTALPLTLTLLVASSQADNEYGLVISAASDLSVITSLSFPATPALDQTCTHGNRTYRCVSVSPYPLWIALGTLSYTRDGERAQWWIAPTKECSIVVVSVSPYGATVGEPRQFFFDKDATLPIYLSGTGASNPVVIYVFYQFDNNYEISTIPSGGVTLNVSVNSTIYTVGTVYQTGVIFGSGLVQLASTVPSGTIQQFTGYFTVNNVKYYLTFYVMGTGGGSSDTTGPSLTVTGVTNGGTVKGTVAITATATDSSGIAGIAIYVDGVLVSSSSTSPLSYSWVTGGWADGSHKVVVNATDGVGNVTTATYTVTTGNTGGINVGIEGE